MHLHTTERDGKRERERIDVGCIFGILIKLASVPLLQNVIYNGTKWTCMTLSYADVAAVALAACTQFLKRSNKWNVVRHVLDMYTNGSYLYTSNTLDAWCACACCVCCVTECNPKNTRHNVK